MEKNEFVEFSSPLVKEEKKLMHFLIKNELKHQQLTFLLEDLEIPELKNQKINFIDRFVKKGIYIHFKDGMTFLSIFQSYTFKGEFVEFTFNPDFVEYLKDEEKIFKFNLPQVLFFKYDFSIDFFYKVVKPNFLESKKELSIEEFKAIIDKDKYKRVYDIKRFLIEPIIEDINLSTNFKLSYNIEKIGKSYKISFDIKNNKIDEIKNYVQNFLRLYKKYILEPEKLKKTIFIAIQTHGYGYTKNKLLLSIKNKQRYKLKFDDIFEKFLNNELGDFYVALKRVECKVTDRDQLRKRVNKEISCLNLPEISTLDYNTNLAKKIFGMKEREEVTILSENLKIELFYDTVKDSKITVYLKYVK